MNIAYLINQYPMVSLSFIRREITALEAKGVPITRFSIRTWGFQVVDTADKIEFEKTNYILHQGIIGLVLAVLQVALTRTISLLKTIWLTWKIGIRSDRGLLINFIYFAEACVLLQWVNKYSIEHIHCHFGNNSTTVAMLCNALGGPPYSFTVHGPEDFDKPKAIALPEKIKRAMFVVGVSYFTKSQLFRWCDYKQWSKIHIIRCGVDDMFLAQPYIPLPRSPQFVCVGRLSEQKGHLLLIEAISRLATEGLKFKVVFVGDGELRPEIETLITQLQLKDYIEITGWATNSQVQKHILNSQVMIVPSFAEGLPVVIMEALALYRPVISTYIAGIPELVKEGTTGWLVPSGSVEDLASAMKTALQTPLEKLEKMGFAGAELVQQNHNVGFEADKLLDLFHKYHSLNQ